jgi:two-component system sensor histidine kinase DegS
MNQQLSALADDLERDQQTLQRELDEIDLLLKQASSEAERHEARRVEAEARLTAVERDSGPVDEQVAEARSQLLSQTRRATLMQSQLDVLAGKHRALQRYRERVAAALPLVRDAARNGVAPGGSGGEAAANPGEVLAAQEEMRREIARQMHDGPAQSIANIALQAQIVQRLFERDPERAQQGLTDLVGMVQQALEATKSFIFDVRPMVLDDLGLVPTLRRAAREWTRQSGSVVRFESVGTDRRLATDIESGLFRIFDDAVEGYLTVNPAELTVRLDWSELGLRATVRGTPAGGAQSAETRARAAVAAARRDKSLPQALTSMIHQQESDDAARRAGLPAHVLAEIEQRATSLGIDVKLSDDRWHLELTVRRRA